MNRTLRLAIPLLCGVLLSFLLLLPGCKTFLSPGVEQTEQFGELQSTRLCSMIIPTKYGTIDDIFLLPSEFPKIENMKPCAVDTVFSRMIIVIWDGETAYGLVFDKFDFTLYGAIGVGNAYKDMPAAGKAWIYKHEFPIECTIWEQDAWLIELDIKLSKLNRTKA